MRLILAVLTVALLVVPGESIAKPQPAKCVSTKQAILFYRTATWKWETLQYGRHHTRTNYAERTRASCPYLRWVAKYWVLRNYKARAKYRSHLRTISNDPRRLGRHLASKYGWVGDEWDCLEHLWGPLEGGWNVYADNPNSDAYGIPQALPGWKMGDGWQHSAKVQITWGLGYISGRYGTPCQARSHRLRYGYY